MENSAHNCAIVVPSCDSYEEVWGPFFSFFFKYWPDCPFPVYLITETKKAPDPRVKAINLGKDYGWSDNMDKVLSQISEKYFIYFLEDVFITKKVDTDRILRLLELAKNDHVSCLRLFPHPGPDTQYVNASGPVPELGVIAKDAPYRSSTMTAIWDKEAFKRLLKAGENAWQFELDGTKRASMMDELYLSVWPKDVAIHEFATAIKKGRWQYDALQLCKKEGIPVATKRPVEGMGGYVTRRLAYLPLVGGFFRKGRRWYYDPKKK